MTELVLVQQPWFFSGLGQPQWLLLVQGSEEKPSLPFFCVHQNLRSPLEIFLNIFFIPVENHLWKKRTADRLANSPRRRTDRREFDALFNALGIEQTDQSSVDLRQIFPVGLVVFSRSDAFGTRGLLDDNPTAANITGHFAQVKQKSGLTARITPSADLEHPLNPSAPTNDRSFYSEIVQSSSEHSVHLQPLQSE